MEKTHFEVSHGQAKGGNYCDDKSVFHKPEYRRRNSKDGVRAGFEGIDEKVGQLKAWGSRKLLPREDGGGINGKKEGGRLLPSIDGQRRSAK